MDLDNLFSHQERRDRQDREDFRDDCRDRDRDGCRAVVKRNVGVRTPVSLDVNARTGRIRVVCSEPRITEGRSDSQCRSTKCEFTINQTISVEIPICYHVRTDVDDSYVDCDVDTD